MAQARLLQWAQKKKTYLHMPIKGKKIGKKFRKQGVLREIHTKIKISLCSHCINDYKGRWSEWGDSNSRHLDPKELMDLFSNLFCSFLALSVPKTVLSEPVLSTVSTCSEPVYGQKCGQNRFPQKWGSGSFILAYRGHSKWFYSSVREAPEYGIPSLQQHIALRHLQHCRSL